MIRIFCFLFLAATANAQQWTINGQPQPQPLTVSGDASIVIEMSDATVHVRTQPLVADAYELSLREIIALARQKPAKPSKVKRVQ